MPNPKYENPSTPDILVLDENTTGNDIVIGDVHGEITLLANLAKDLGTNDRLIIVGDLADRGEDSLAIFEFIKKFFYCGKKFAEFGVRQIHQDRARPIPMAVLPRDV